MDTRYFGTNLLRLDQTGGNRPENWTNAAEDAYYRRHAPAAHGSLRAIMASSPRLARLLVGHLLSSAAAAWAGAHLTVDRGLDR